MADVPLPKQLTQLILQALQRGATIVTANQRAARGVRRAYDLFHHLRGESLWSPPEVFAWDTWLIRLWGTMLLDGIATELMLNELQEHSIWRTILREDESHIDTLRSFDSLAELAATAWKTINQYGDVDKLRGRAHTQETRSFVRWAKEFQHRCHVHGWVSSAVLEERIGAAVRSGGLSLKGEIALLGFDEVLPSRSRLLGELQATNMTITHLDNEESPRRCMVVQIIEEQAELEAAARWAKDILDQSRDVSVAVVVPNLAAKRSAIDRTFRRIVAPTLEGIEQSNYSAPYEFSVGVRLADTPLVQIALDLLHWAHAPLSVERVNALLISPLFAMEPGDLASRSIFDAMELRRAKFLRPEISTRWLLEMMKRSRRPLPSTFVEALQALRAATETWNIAKAARSYADWTAIIHNILNAAQWGRKSGEDSVEYQTRRRWEATLDHLATMDFSGEKVHFESVLEELKRLTRNIVFAPESRETPVQILGPLETAGAQFDAIWFMGAGDLTWPARPAPNPLLPWSLQAELEVPGVDAAADDRRSRFVAERVARIANTVVFSYSSETAAGRQRLSSALRDLKLESTPIDTLVTVPPVTPPIALEEFQDTTPLLPPDRVIQGGAEILRLQAACGFRAFAEKRLFADELQSMEFGMDAAERGNVVHRTLEHFWEEVKSQSVLKTMSPEARQSILQRAIDYGLRKALQTATTSWDEAYIAVQRRRLLSLIDAWLDIELKRAPFEVRVSEKDFKDVTIGPLRLGVRVDRVDATEDGDVIIDYKTGRARSADWLGLRPDAPQLPLYAVLATEIQPETKLADVAFAVVRAGNQAGFDSCTRKITREANKTARKPIELKEQLETWRDVLYGLATSFHVGDTSVDPKNYPRTCQYCAHRTFCRLNPEELNFEEDLDEQTEDSVGS